MTAFVLTIAVLGATALWPLNRWVVKGEGRPEIYGFFGCAFTAALCACVALVSGQPLAVGPMWVPCAIGMYFLIMDRISYAQLRGMAAPRCATLLMLGDEDEVIQGPEVFHRGHQETFAEAQRLYAEAGAPEKSARQVYPGAGHRPFSLSVEALLWMERHWGLPRWSREDILGLPTVLMADWAYDNGVIFEQHYGTLHHYAGTVVPDVGVRCLAPHELACLSPKERCAEKFSIDKWLEHIQRLPPSWSERI